MPDILAMLTHERDKLNRAIEALGGEIGGALGRVARAVDIVRGKRTMSPAARARISAAQKARWAKTKGTPAKVAPGKRFMSPAARAKIAASQKARWARMKDSPAKATTAATAPVKKYTLSAESRANIAAGARKRWARIKAGK
jgi:hypothetical protein